MSKKYEDIPLKTIHYIECTGNQNLLVDEEYVVRVIKESKVEKQVKEVK